MKKIVIEGIILVSLFFSTLYFLRLVDWMRLFRVEKVTQQTEEKLGKLYWEIFEQTEKDNKNIFVLQTVDSLLQKICTKNYIEPNKLKVHIVNSDEINAFALPDGHLVINEGLILACDNPEELCGVISHELAHIELDHVMKKLIKEIGLSVIISMSTGKNSSDNIKETARMLSSSSFDRSLEREADIRAVDYLSNARFDTEALANFLMKISNTEDSNRKYFNWISTHPDTKERVRFILEYSAGKKVNKIPALPKQTWLKLREELKK